MEYSGLIQAINEKNYPEVNKLIMSLRLRLISFLRLKMSASKTDAEDCAHEAVLRCLNVIKQGKMKDPERVYSYLVTTCKNIYLDMHRLNREYPHESPLQRHYQRPDQLIRLLDAEKNRIINWCLKQLKREHREFMEYWLELPDSDAESAANYFGISKSNVWTRKHRILTLLNRCYEEKANYNVGNRF